MLALVLCCHATASLAFDDWLSRRDAGVVRQSLDYSCGVAALATILTHYFNTPVSERSLLMEHLHDRDGLPDESAVPSAGVSFADLKQLARARGFLALGISLSFADLARLRHPVIVALDLDGREHFSVLRRADMQSISLADPSWGNHVMRAGVFQRHFLRDAEGTRGRALLILDPSGAIGDPGFMRHEPPGAFLTPGLLLAPHENQF